MGMKNSKNLRVTGNLRIIFTFWVLAWLCIESELQKPLSLEFWIHFSIVFHHPGILFHHVLLINKNNKNQSCNHFFLSPWQAACFFLKLQKNLSFTILTSHENVFACGILVYPICWKLSRFIIAKSFLQYLLRSGQFTAVLPYPHFQLPAVRSTGVWKY